MLMIHDLNKLNYIFYGFIFKSKDDTNNILMSGVDNVDSNEPSTDGVEEIRRFRRSVPSLQSDTFQMVKE